MMQGKRTREDCRGEVFSTQVIVGYPRKMVVLNKTKREGRAMIDGKMVATNQENGYIKNSEIPIEGGGT